jgi:hypothetical protein
MLLPFSILNERKNQHKKHDKTAITTTVLSTEGCYELKMFQLVFNVKIKGIINPSHEQDRNFQLI